MITYSFSICPDCREIAEIRDRFVLPSTDGPIEHVRVFCVRRHHFVLPVAGLDRASVLIAPAADTHPVPKR